LSGKLKRSDKRIAKKPAKPVQNSSVTGKGQKAARPKYQQCRAGRGLSYTRGRGPEEPFYVSLGGSLDRDNTDDGVEAGGGKGPGKRMPFIQSELGYSCPSKGERAFSEGFPI